MSSASQIAVLPPLGRRSERSGADAAEGERPGVRLAVFAAFALYGGLRWSSLLNPEPTGRILGLLVVSVVLAGAGAALGRRSRAFPAILGVLALLLMFALCGVPFSWVRHLRIALTANGIAEGLSGLPRVLVPYSGLNPWIRTVIMLGAGVLMLDAALMLAFAPRRLSEARRAAAALPLIALAVIPSTVARPNFVYLHGLLLFALLALFIWGERLQRDDLATVSGLAAVAAVAALALSPALDSHKPWINYEALASGLAPGHVESFDWSQRYGPLAWPRKGHEVIDVKAKRADYWKAENLDRFDGRAWVAGPVAGGDEYAGVDASAMNRWTQTIRVTMRAMKTNDVIAAGLAGQPTNVSSVVSPGRSPGTWTAATQLGPGDSYAVSVYDPRPSAAQLKAAGDDYSVAPVAGYRTMTLPPTGRAARPLEVVFPEFHSHAPVFSPFSGPAQDDAAPLVRSSPYGRAYALAQRLERKAATPYAFVASVQAYLGHDFNYNENTPRHRYPLESFLFHDKYGYCQQFAGSMALLLRMGGIPARVAVGFTTGTYDAVSGQWIVGDTDAHAWVEAWFPHYGWVRFDPTPPAAPARGGKVPILPAGALPHGATAAPAGVHGLGTPLGGTTNAVKHGGGTSIAVVIVPAVMLLGLAAVVLLITRAPADPRTEDLLAELERALARSGRPISVGVTLAELEHRFRIAPEAAAYVRTLRLARFGGASELPTPDQRRALRAQLRAGLGLGGALRGLWALPPRWRPPGRGARQAGEPPVE